MYGQNVQNRKVGSFSAISVCCGIEVIMTTDQSSDIRLEATPEILSAVITRVKGNGTLEIIFDNEKRKKLGNGHFKVKAYVPVKDYNKLEASSGGSINGEKEINSNDIKLTASSGGRISIAVKSSNIICDVSSGAGITLSGSSVSGDFSASSGANIDAKNMQLTKLKADASSAGGVTISVKNELNANASSGGYINYYGNPSNTNVNSSSGGSINRK